MCLSQASLHKTRAWKVLNYEVQMFLGIDHIRKNLQSGNGPNTQLIRNALVESSLLHIRILVDIFLSRGNRPDDIHLEHLGFDPNSLQPALAERIRALAAAYGVADDKNGNCWTINKRLAHPTTHRTEKYDYSKVFAALDKPLREIIEFVYSSSKRKLPYPLKS
jgi:hypothetical protein